MQDLRTPTEKQIDALQIQIEELNAVRRTIAINPGQSVDIGGVSYEFQNQSELDAVLNPIIREFNFLNDSLMIGRYEDGEVPPHTHPLPEHTHPVPDHTHPRQERALVVFDDIDNTVTTLTLPEGWNETGKFYRIISVFERLSPLRFYHMDVIVPVAIALAGNDQHFLNASTWIRVNTTTGALALPSGHEFLYVALEYT